MKMLAVLLGLAALLAAAYYGLQGTKVSTVEGREPSAPKQQLDNVRAKARSIEDDTQKRADELLRKSQ